ncbi:hypothetical protein X777_00916 [Ooceraea biroi]|uniref:Uncharacterized protein n=1 Tax=Ooceraea biroi TaxID=2015173 RepID=A0A026WRT3_OOCBI|nr:hypothetical protein X777_00916 [Ooceraea biroi]
MFVFLSKHHSIVGYSTFTGDSNVYDYSNSVTNTGYLGSKDGYQNIESFYGAGDAANNHKLSNHISSHSLINAANQGNIGGDAENNYNGYSANNHGSEYAGYSNTYENSDRDTYVLSTRATPTSFRGYSGHSNNEEPAFNAYSSGSVRQDSNFAQYSGDNKRIPAYSRYSKPVLENYPEDSADSDAQGYHDSSDSPGYSDGDQSTYPRYSPGGPIGEYSFGKQKGGPYGFKDRNKYGDAHSAASEMRYTRGNAGRVSHNRDVSSHLSDSRPSGQFFNAQGVSSGKPNKYSYKYLSRYTPNSGVSYLLRERDAYYAPYGKGNGKILIIKESRPSHAHSESSYGDNGGYRGKNGGYATLSNFDRYGGSSNNYDDGPTMPRRYRYAVGPMVIQRTVYS